MPYFNEISDHVIEQLIFVASERATQIAVATILHSYSEA
jgi:hypothetical protein